MTKEETIKVLQSIEDRAVNFPYMTACDWVAIAAAKRHLTNISETKEFVMPVHDSMAEDEHWQDVRERAAIAAMQGLLSCGEDAFSYQGVTDEIAKGAVDCANSLIEELKNLKCVQNDNKIEDS